MSKRDTSHSLPPSSSSSSPRLPTAAEPTRHTMERHAIDDTQTTRAAVLTHHWSSSPSRQPALPSAHTLAQASPTAPVAIYPLQNIYSTQISQDVRDSLSAAASAPAPSTSSSPFAKNASQRAPSGSNSQLYNNGSVTASSSRLRTSTHPVFETPSQLAAHHGIPRRLPPTPRVNNLGNKPPVPLFDDTTSPASDTSSTPLDNLMSSYLDMISRNPDNTTAVDQSPAIPQMNLEPQVNDEMAALAVAGLFAGGCDSSTTPWNEFLTSPYDDESPFEGMLETPLQDDMVDLNNFADYLSSPLVAGADNAFGDLPLFPQTPAKAPEPALDVPKMSTTTVAQPRSLTTSPNFDGLLTLSPCTPSLDATPLINDSPNPAHVGARHRSRLPNGTRKGVTPETLVPLDAPTQPRNYLTPSTTSRKELPAVFARKRTRGAAFVDEEDELAEEADVPIGNEADAIAAKRRQNTLAARRSRKRKLEYQQQLETMLEQEQREKEMWKTRAQLFHNQLQAIGIPMPLLDEA